MSTCTQLHTLSTPSESSRGAADCETSDELIQKILEVKGRLAQNEDEVVAAIFEKGRLLVALKSRSKRDWGKNLRKSNVAPRVASRLMAIGSRGLELGLIESDLLKKLPQDVHKLERLVKLEFEQLSQLVENLDCRSESRPKVIRAVKEALGQVKLEAEADDSALSLVAIEKLLKRLVDQVEKVRVESSDSTAKKRLNEILVDAMERMEKQAGTSHP